MGFVLLFCFLKPKGCQVWIQGGEHVCLSYAFSAQTGPMDTSHARAFGLLRVLVALISCFCPHLEAQSMQALIISP